MTRKLLTVDQFRGAKDAERTDAVVMRVMAGDPEESGDRKLRFIFSDGTVDRAGDSIDPSGWNTDAFKTNPVALWAHDSFSPPIGRASNVGTTGGKLMGDIEFMPADISPFADSLYRMYKAKFLKAVSVGFIPLEWSFVNDSKRPYGIDFKKTELLEISGCAIPCNPSALQEAKAAGIDISPLREWAAKLLDEGGQVLVPRNLLEETFRQAKTPRSVRQKFLAKSEAPDWKAGAARDLPIDEAHAWDGAAAAKRVLDDAGFDGDSPNGAKAARGFLLHDAANPLLRGSYKLPFADIVGGEIKAIKGGISAAKGRLDQTEAPVGVLDDASAVIDGYEEKIGSGDKSLVVPLTKSGRSISSANQALLQEAMDHHASATKCIKDVLAGNEPDDDVQDPAADPGDDKPAVIVLAQPAKVLTEDEKRAKRLADARALRASVKL